MKKYITLSLSSLFISVASYAASFEMIIEGQYLSSASASVAGNDWTAVFRYDTSIPEDMSSGLYYTAITSASFTTSGQTYTGVPGNLGQLGGTTLPGNPFAPAGTYVQISDNSNGDRVEYRSRLYLNGDTQQQDIEIFEIVLEDRSTATLLDSYALPETFDFSAVDNIFFATRFGSNSLDFGEITSVGVSPIPEPSSVGIVVATTIFVLSRRRSFGTTRD